MIDLHLHTIHSDGTDTVQSLLQKAEQAQLRHIAITDHNSVNTYFDNEFVAQNDYSGTILPGIELTTTFNGEIIEVLGYMIDVHKMHTLLQQHVLTFEQKQRAEYALLKNAYAKFPYDEKTIQFDPKKTSSRKLFWKALMQHDENIALLTNPKSAQVSSIFTRYEVYNPESPFYVDQTSLYPSLETVVQMIHDCGGKAFLAHLHEYKSAQIIRKNLANFVTTYHLDGVECYYSTFTPSQIDDLVAFCDSHHLLKSGGSDYHGDRKPNIQIGMAQVPESLIADWSAIE